MHEIFIRETVFYTLKELSKFFGVESYSKEWDFTFQSEIHFKNFIKRIDIFIPSHSDIRPKLYLKNNITKFYLGSKHWRTYYLENFVFFFLTVLFLQQMSDMNAQFII